MYVSWFSTTTTTTTMLPIVAVISSLAVVLTVIEGSPTVTKTSTHQQRNFNISGHFFSGGDLNIKEDVCWRESYGRGVGKPIHACPDGQDKDAGLCYKKCRENYKGVGPVCWEHCRSGYTDTGAFCTKGGKIIGADNGGCPWYDKCGLTFAKGCSHCPEHDPAYHNDGCTCRYDPHTYAKDSYGRGVGKPLGCSKDEDYDAGLCYTPCREKYKGVGPVCWLRCPSKIPTDYVAVCCQSSGVCNSAFSDAGFSTVTAIIAGLKTAITVEDELEEKEKVTVALQEKLGYTMFPCSRYYDYNPDEENTDILGKK